jgi:type IV pilus assembly protein PilB
MTATAEVKKPRMLGERLLEAGMVTPVQLRLALSEQRRSGGMLGETLERLGFVTQESISRLLASESRTEFVDLEGLVVDADVLRSVPADFARAKLLLPISREGDVLTIAMADSFDVMAVDAVEKLTGLRVEVMAAPAQAIQEAIDHKYAHAVTLDQLVEEALGAGITSMGDDAGSVAPLVRMVDLLIARAVRQRATDIHIEPEEAMVRVRYRVDGVLHPEALLPKVLQAAIEARVKIMSGLDVTEHRLPQDGRIGFKLGRKQIDLRVSTLPTQYGESIVMRVLDKNSTVLSLDVLGIQPEDKKKLERAIARPHGIILVTGPTGSGKTTTLYAALSQMDSLRQSIFTLEDPVEYRLPMIRQTQINSEIGMTFAGGLRSLLRQDPDVILVGEIRDEETAQLATRAALTGHLVLSTLHTNSAAGAIPRLINMGVEPYLLGSALQAVIAQRLIRRVCNHCAEPLEQLPPEFEYLAKDVPAGAKFRRGKGCAHCFGTGCSGRVAVYEVMTMTEEITRLLKPGVTDLEIFESARSSGMSTLFEDGIIKAANGLASLDDLIQVVA